MLTWYIAFLFSTKESLSLSLPPYHCLGTVWERPTVLGASASLHLIRLATAIQQYLPCCKNLTPSTFVFTFESFPHSLSLSLIMCYKHDGQSQAVSQGKACLFPRYIMITFKTSIIISYFLSSVPISSVRLIVSTAFDVKTRLLLVKWSQLLESALFLCFVKPTNGWQWTKNNDNDNNDRDTVNNLK